jgi:DNA-binding winged helix-turn-helix (wHTH) protein
MKMVMIGGGVSDEARLRVLLQRANLDIDVGRVDRNALQAERAPGPRGSLMGPPSSGRAALERPDSAPRALLIEALQGLELATRALLAVRADPHFEATIAIVGVYRDGGEGYERARVFDDFVTHPWSGAEVWARIVAAEQRRGELEPGSIVQIGGVWMDTLAREAQVDGRPVQLTAREFALLSYLCVRRGCVLSRHHLLEQVWGRAYAGGQRTVDVHIRRLRSKLGPGLRIDTVRSGGYRLRAVPCPPASEHDGVTQVDVPGDSAEAWAALASPVEPTGRRWPLPDSAPGAPS